MSTKHTASFTIDVPISGDAADIFDRFKETPGSTDLVSIEHTEHTITLTAEADNIRDAMSTVIMEMVLLWSTAKTAAGE